ncbi:MAG: FMN-binding negative transcriptional regulator [Chitinophagaceae bacterium]
MYNIPYFKEQDNQVILQFMRAHSFALVIGCNDNKPAATQLPLLMEEREGKLFLLGHFMRSTDHHKAFEKNNEVLCVFTGPHAYVSAGWYTQPQQASTWNYMTVHARGKMKFTSEEKLREILERTTSHYEGGEHTAAGYHQLPLHYIDKLIGAIVGFEIEVESLENVFKLSQNRDAQSYHSIIHHLQNGDANAHGVAAEMQKRTEQLHGNRS